ncbi:hypothetical protein ABD76_00140 [Paenibacillus dendritiformis]|jgi:inhibitor of KinA sporulation pathway (predicted exonuclease)|uniref:hypothetical protein n=1 Tax=Paenibacillus dendritiformis TaxID=130049 RepID=UPI0018CC858C|nr:hypothetical protein [Paenibacillus dendritiformis]MBG9791032.1 hypothetical protein [Paenibacillus dendritiformis]
MSRCQWVITVDHITQGKRVGTVGPWDAELSAEAIQHHPEGQPFRLKDDDGQLYFEGVYVGPDDGDLFAPLDDFGMPDAGCTQILYQDSRGRWEFL